MRDENLMLELAASDMGGLTIEDVKCTDCIEGFCPARTASVFDSTSFTLCGAKKASQPVLEAYQERTGCVLHIERPC